MSDTRKIVIGATGIFRNNEENRQMIPTIETQLKETYPNLKLSVVPDDIETKSAQHTHSFISRYGNPQLKEILENNDVLYIEGGGGSGQFSILKGSQREVPQISVKTSDSEKPKPRGWKNQVNIEKKVTGVVEFMEQVKSKEVKHAVIFGALWYKQEGYRRYDDNTPINILDFQDLDNLPNLSDVENWLKDNGINKILCIRNVTNDGTVYKPTWLGGFMMDGQKPEISIDLGSGKITAVNPDTGEQLGNQIETPEPIAQDTLTNAIIKCIQQIPPPEPAAALEEPEAAKTNEGANGSTGAPAANEGTNGANGAGANKAPAGGKSRRRRNKKQSKRRGKNNKKRKTSRGRKMRKTRRNNKKKNKKSRKN